jgi:ABC-type glycerol-3-phosphate transport system substrate-binding protein
MRHQRKRVVRFSKPRLIALGMVATLALAACGSASGTSKTVPGQSPAVTTAPSSSGYNY